jgi:DNA repair exonuclease SbcCD ATPase subunit
MASKVRFKKVSVRNFLSIGSIDLDLENKNLCLIEGSNGSGKSSLITDSIIWVIWDETLRGIKKDNVVNRTSKRDCSVSIDLNIDGKDFNISRYRKHRNFKNNLIIIEEGKKLNFSTTKKANDYLKSIFPIDKDTFLHTVILGQGFQNRFSLLNDSGRKSLLESIINVKIYDVCYDIIKRKYNDRLKSIQALESKKEYVEEVLNNTQKEINSLNKDLIQIIDLNKENKHNLEDSVVSLQEEIATLSQRLTQFSLDSGS